MGCQVREACQKSCCLTGMPLNLSVCPKGDGILAMRAHTFTEKENKNDAKLQGTGVSFLLCL